MAKKRDSFLFYRDWAEALKCYPTELKCELFDAIVDFALDCKEKEDLSDAARLIFEAFRPKILRDAEKYQEACVKNRLNGKMGGRPKRGEVEEKENPNNPVGFQKLSGLLKTQKTQPNRKNPKNPTEPDNDNDNDNDNDIYISIIENNVDINNTHYQQILDEFLSDDLRIEQFCMSQGIDIDTCKRLAAEVVNEWALTDTEHVSKQDAKMHLLNSIRAKCRVNNNGNNNRTTTGTTVKDNPLDRATVHRAKIG